MNWVTKLFKPKSKDQSDRDLIDAYDAHLAGEKLWNESRLSDESESTKFIIKSKTKNYRSTPFNIFSGGLILISILIAIKSGPGDYEILVLIYLPPISLIVLLIDFFIQRSLADRYKQILIIETSILILLFVIFFFH